MRKKNEPIHYNKSLAKIFTIGNEPKRYPPSKRFTHCNDTLSMSTVVLAHCVDLVNGLGVVLFCGIGFD
jgi:hypothetical protein